MNAIARRRLNGILSKAERLRIPREVVVRLATNRSNESNPTERIPFGRWLFAVAVAVAVVVCRSELYTRDGIARAFSYWAQESDQCAVWMPDVVKRACRPPVDCRMCQNVLSIDRVSNITPEEFEKRYAFSGRPVIVTDAMSNWTAPATFSFNFFQELYADSVAQDECQFFPYKTEFRALWEVFQMDEDRARMTDGSAPWYVGWSNCDEQVGRILREHYDRPYFLPETSENKNTDWVFMGTPGYGAQLHVDNVNNPSWQAQLTGSKNWTLKPPLECTYECIEHQITVQAGEIFVLDTNSWYHSTMIVSNGISITIGAEYD